MSEIPQILQRRHSYRPFRYPEAFEFYDLQNKSHWVPDEVTFGSDIQEFRTEFSEAEKHAVTTILRTFTSLENVVGEYWTSVVAKWFPHPEICMMARTFASFEAIHAHAYDRLNVELGLDTEEFYLSFLENPDMKAKMLFVERAIDVEKPDDIPLSLACFSAFTEGVSLYSSFAVLLNFQRFNKLKNVANILEWSVKDESLHSKAGCWLYRTYMAERKMEAAELEAHNEQVRKIAIHVYEMECAIINEIFAKGEFLELSAESLKAFAHNRLVSKLKELGVPTELELIPEKITKWFNEIVDGRVYNDSFESRSTSYTKGWDFGATTW